MNGCEKKEVSPPPLPENDYKNQNSKLSLVRQKASILSLIATLERKFEERPRVEIWQEFFYDFESQVLNLKLSDSNLEYALKISREGRDTFERNPHTESWQEAAAYLRSKISSLVNDK